MSSSALPLPALGTHIGNYRLERLVGRGGMGAVYEAFNQSVGGRAAIKILLVHAASLPEVTKRFFDEARAANSIEHPSIIRIFDSGWTPEGLAYLIMEFLKGETLGRRITRLGRLPVAEAIRLTRQIASALGAVHERGVVHRDLKPENLMVVGDPEAPGGERIKVLDFGIARLAGDLRAPGSETASNVWMGTPAYMSPEQCHGAKQVTAQSDVYSLGVILYKMLAGQEPFVSQGPGALISMHLTEQPAPIQHQRPELPGELARLLHSMLEKTPSARPTMRQVDGSLRGLISVVEASPKDAPASRNEAVTRKLAPVDLRAMLPSAAPPAQPDPKQPVGPAHERASEDTRRPRSAPPSLAMVEAKTLSRSLRRRILFAGLIGSLLAGAGIAAHAWKGRQPLSEVPTAATNTDLLPVAGTPDLARSESSRSAAGLDPVSPSSVEQNGPGEKGSSAPDVPVVARPPTVPTKFASPQPVHNALGIPPFREAGSVTETHVQEKAQRTPDLPLKQEFPGPSSKRLPDGGTKRAMDPADEEGLRNPFGR
jgi:hypothetical protein